MYHEWLQPGAPRKLEDYQGCNIDRRAGDIMKISETVTSAEDHDSTPSPRRNPVKLSRRAAVKRNSTKDRKTEAERHDNSLQNTPTPVMTPGHTSGNDRTTKVPLLLRRFSFEQTSNEEPLDLAGREDAAELSSMSDFQDVPLTPVSDESRQLQLFTEAQQRRRPTGVEHGQTAEPKDSAKERRRVPTTFDEILGPRKIPTALL